MHGKTLYGHHMAHHHANENTFNKIVKIRITDERRLEQISGYVEHIRSVFDGNWNRCLSVFKKNKKQSYVVESYLHRLIGVSEK